MERLLLALAIAVYAGIGLWCVSDPAGALAPVGVSLDDAGLVEARAMYGGLELGMAVFLAWCWREAPRVGLGAATCTLGGLGMVRLIAAASSGTWGLHALLCAVECTGAALGAVVLWRR